MTLRDHQPFVVGALRPAPPASVSVLAYDGVDELDLFGVYSVLAKAQASGAIADVGLFAPGPSVTASGGAEIRTAPLKRFNPGCNVLVVPGGSGAAETAKSNLLSRPVRAAHNRGARIYCCCSGALIVASALKLLDGQLAIHARKKAELKAIFKGEVVDGLIESNGIVSIGGRRSTSVKSVDLAFRILSDLDPDLPGEISRRTEIAWSGTP